MGPKNNQLAVPPQPQPGQILRMRYHDTATLQKGLDEIYGMDQYEMKCRNDRWIVYAQRPLTTEELDELEKRMFQHYQQDAVPGADEKASG